jgi:hypothetical protein
MKDIMNHSTETLEGYVVDIACIRNYPRDELLERARVHTRECGLHGHCIESGYGLVNEEGRLLLLDPKATWQVLEVIRNSKLEAGIELRAMREMKNGEMETTSVEEI